ncbi:ABC transporter permease [Sphingobacterium sp. lm-10]|uniref:ABC transporter permease n=1 Tax=Sphingobacterium sp. lm-10 TaxID=2944904 RepID=UPI00201FE085|nr:ABC transporter permease [Sphingobacterium sp. lm-10]MCL7988091.1 ABC transporter permease [Sphingobacterium sp. lm-10]
MENIKTAWRRLKNNKFYTFVNILGLSVSLATAIMIILWVQDERSFDQFHPDSERIYKISSHMQFGDSPTVWEGAPGPIALLARAIPEVESASRVTYNAGGVLENRKTKAKSFGSKVAFVDESFFSIFNFPLVEGQSSTFLADQRHILLTPKMAIELFGNEDIVGETLEWQGEPFTVTGIVDHAPQNSSINFDALIPLSYHAAQFTKNGGNMNWKTIDEDLGNYAFNTYVKLQSGADHSIVSGKISEGYKKLRDGESSTLFSMDRLSELHLVSADGNKSALRLVQVFTIIIVLLLVIGAINYVNLSTARSLERAKDVGIRKVIGASRIQLYTTFALETTLIFAIALSLAIVFVWALIPGYNSIAGKSLTFSLGNLNVWWYIGMAIGGTLLLASVYPALQLTSFSALRSLKGQLNKHSSASVLRKGLVIFQFTISITLIIATLVIKNQLHYIRDKNLGYDKEQIFTVNLDWDAVQAYDAISNELATSTAIQSTALTGVYNLADHGEATGDLEWAGKSAGESIIVTQANVDKNFLPLLNLELLEGHNFTGLPSDSSSFIINEALAKQIGLKLPYTGQTLNFHGMDGQIIGVVKDFHYKSLKEKIGPMLMWTHWYRGALYVKAQPGMAEQAIAAVETQYKKYPSDFPFKYSFLDAKFDELYKSDNRTGLLFNIFSGIAIFISALGLFALTTYSAQIRIKEIGIRKVLGASVLGLVHLLSKEFIALVCISIVVASPIAWYLMNEWLSSFSYRTNVNLSIFVIGGLIAIVLAYLTIGLRAIQAAMANPVKSLRDE